jgi:hypothetical protein
MTKAHRVLLHIACIARKSARGVECRWHWQHLLREFGLGEYSCGQFRLKTRNMEETKCSI